MREFRFVGKKSAPLLWTIEQTGETYTTTHGMLGGAMQSFSDRPGDKGKPGTKAYMDPVANCAFAVNREIRKKLESGYIEYVDGKPTAEQISEIKFDTFLPKNFCGYKPQTSIEPAALEKLHKKGLARYSRKMDGMSHIAVHHPTGWEIYSRRMDLSSERFPLHLELLSNTDYGVGTILVGEMVCIDKQKMREDFKAISSVCRSLPEETRKIIKEGKVPEPTFVIFDILFHNGKDLKDVSYDERAKLWKNKFAPMADMNSLIHRIDFYDVTPDTWEKVAKENGWEGFVVTDGSAIPGNKFFSFDGDASRPKGHHKLKPCYTEEVVAFAAAPGSGKRLGGIGAVHVKQKHPDTGMWMYVGKCGSGFTEEVLEILMDVFKEAGIPILEKDKEAEKMDIQNNSGIVMELEYSDRQPGTQKFRFPVYLRSRPDKMPEECYAQKLAPEEE